jgi:hypothetical protein
MNKSAASNELKISKTRVVVRELPPNRTQDVRGGIVVTKVTDCASTNL